MKITAAREDILGPLQSVIGVVERRQTMPILANVMLAARENRLSVTGTDLEVELVASQEVTVEQPGELTLPGRKLLDIFKALPEAVSVTLASEGERTVLRAGRSRFALASLPAAEFPVVEVIQSQQSLKVARASLRQLIDKTHFSMAQQDVRYYLNGMLLESENDKLRAVATDGHRLALCEATLGTASPVPQQVILPRKGVLELQRLLSGDGDLDIAIGTNHVQVTIGDIRFTSKLIDGRFPEYGRVLPTNPSKVLIADRESLRQSFQRTAILSNEKYRGIRLSLRPGQLTIQAHNPEQEEAEDELEVRYEGEELEIGFNVTYLLDALAAIEGEQVEIGLSDPNSSCLIRAPESPSVRYVVMPMRL